MFAKDGLERKTHSLWAVSQLENHRQHKHKRAGLHLGGRGPTLRHATMGLEEFLGLFLRCKVRARYFSGSKHGTSVDLGWIEDDLGPPFSL